MRSDALKWLRFLMIALAAVCVAGVLVPMTAEAQQCQPTKPATDRGAIAPNGSWIASQCPEACGTMPTGVYLRHSEDPNLLDWIYVWCSGGYEAGIPASSTCWNCIDGCAGSNCPAGELCIPIPRQGGSDCRRFACTDPDYELVESGSNSVPYCRRKVACPTCTPATIALQGPTQIRTGEECMWNVAVTAGCSSSSYTYNWYVGTFWVGSGEYYSGGRLSGVPYGSAWKLRVEATYNGAAAGAAEIWVSESNNAAICFN